MRNIVYIVFIIIICACEATTSKTNKVLDVVEAIANEHPDSSQHLLETLYPYSHLNAQQKARCGILLAYVKLQQNKSFASDGLLDYSVAFYRQSKDSMNLFKAYQLKAYQTTWKGEQDSTAYYLRQAIHIIREQDKDLLYSMYMRMSDIYSEPSVKKNYTQAVSYALQALSCATSEKQKAFAMHQIGVCYSFMGRNDSALYYIERAIEAAPPSKDQADYTAYVLNYANTSGVEFSKAEKFLQEMPDKNSLGRLITLGYLYLNHREIRKAKYYCGMADSLYDRNPDKYSVNTYNNLRALKACVKYASQEDVSASDGVSRNDSITQATSRHEAQRQETAEDNLLLQEYVHESQISHQKKNTFILSTVFIVIILFFLYDRRNKKRYIHLRKELDRTRIEQIKLQSEIPEEDKDNISLNMEDIWRKRLDICLKNFSQTGWMKKLQQLDGSEIYPNGTFLPVTERSQLRKALFEEFTDFIIDIKAAGNGINIDDIYLCLFYLLKVSNATISFCMAASESAIRTRKSRLKGKMDSGMYQFVFGK